MCLVRSIKDKSRSRRGGGNSSSGNSSSSSSSSSSEALNNQASHTTVVAAREFLHVISCPLPPGPAIPRLHLTCSSSFSKPPFHSAIPYASLKQNHVHSFCGKRGMILASTIVRENTHFTSSPREAHTCSSRSAPNTHCRDTPWCWGSENALSNAYSASIKLGHRREGEAP